MLFSKNKPLVGLDVGSSSIKAVELAKSKSGYEIVGFGSQALPPDIVVDGAITDAGSVSEAIKAKRWRSMRRFFGLPTTLPRIPGRASCPRRPGWRTGPSS